MGQGFIKATPNILLTSADFPELFNRTFIVNRTNGDKEDGWTLPNPESEHKCYNTDGTTYKPWAIKDTNGKWRIFMVGLPPLNEYTNNSHSCGWRRIESFQPSNGWNDDEENTLITKLEMKLSQIPKSVLKEFENENGISSHKAI